MRTKNNTNPGPVRRCPDCGVSVPPPPFAAPLTTSGWYRCPDCTTAGPDGIRAAMLARTGVEHPANDPAVIAGVLRVVWRAVTVETNRAQAEAEKRTPRLRDEPARIREQRIRQAAAAIDQVGAPSAEPWEHVDARAVRRAVEEAIVAALPQPPRRNAGGPCGICGTRRASRWGPAVRIGPRAGGLSPAPKVSWQVCSPCTALLDSAGGIPTSDAARRRWTASVLGVATSPPPLSVPPLIATYAEFVGPVPDARTADGCSEPWEFVSEADRDVLAQQAPQHRAPEVLDRERRVAAARARVERARHATAPRTALTTGNDR